MPPDSAGANLLAFFLSFISFFISFLSSFFSFGYCIYSTISREFSLSIMTVESVLCNFAIIRVLPFLNNPKDIDPSYKTDLDSCHCSRRKKTPSYNRRNTVLRFKLNGTKCCHMMRAEIALMNC